MPSQGKWVQSFPGSNEERASVHEAHSRSTSPRAEPGAAAAGRPPLLARRQFGRSRSRETVLPGKGPRSATSEKCMAESGWTAQDLGKRNLWIPPPVMEASVMPAIAELKIRREPRRSNRRRRSCPGFARHPQTRDSRENNVRDDGHLQGELVVESRQWRRQPEIRY